MKDKNTSIRKIDKAEKCVAGSNQKRQRWKIQPELEIVDIL